ncbi:MAG: hypothetical protein JO027_10640 [Solirubrobacterales bacterium]|nr:hypothetical protein [Solirubrobacterales bacterium]
MPDPVWVLDPLPELPVCEPLPVDPLLPDERSPLDPVLLEPLGRVVAGGGLVWTGVAGPPAGGVGCAGEAGLVGELCAGGALGFLATAAFFLTVLAVVVGFGAGAFG